jgi:hypothetical protein
VANSDQIGGHTPHENDSTRISAERLRERTDELELLISGLSMVALFAFPGWLFDRYVEVYSLLPLATFAGAVVALPMISTIAYTLGACFLVHLGVRGYWVGLIGLSAIFPEGIRWERARHLGPLTRARLRALVPPIGQAITSADRLASLLFSLITLAALSLLWLGFLGTLLFVGAAWVGGIFGATNAVLSRSTDVAILLVLGAALLGWFMDAVLARRWPLLQEWAWYRAVVRLLSAIVGVAVPIRLIAPLRLTLQTNTHPRVFALGFLILVLVMPLLGVTLFQSRFAFDPLGTQRFVSSQDVAAGMRSATYESLRTPQDRVRGTPMIPAPSIDSAWLPVFLPYVPIRDDMVLQQRCPALGAAAQQQPQEAPEPRRLHTQAVADCLMRIWNVQLDGAAIELQGAVVSERRDLGYRGLSAFIDLRGSAPGPRELLVTWRPGPEQDQQLDDYMSDTLVYRIPFLWTPEFAAEARP